MIGAEKPISTTANVRSINRLRRRAFGGFCTVNRLASNPSAYLSITQVGRLGDGVECSDISVDLLRGSESDSRSPITPRCDKRCRMGSSCLAEALTIDSC